MYMCTYVHTLLYRMKILIVYYHWHTTVSGCRECSVEDLRDQQWLQHVWDVPHHPGGPGLCQWRDSGPGLPVQEQGTNACEYCPLVYSMYAHHICTWIDTHVLLCCEPRTLYDFHTQRRNIEGLCCICKHSWPLYIYHLYICARLPLPIRIPSVVQIMPEISPTYLHQGCVYTELILQTTYCRCHKTVTIVRVLGVVQWRHTVWTACYLNSERYCRCYSIHCVCMHK